MTLVVVNFSDVDAGLRRDLGTADSLWVGQDGLIAATDLSTTVSGTGSGHAVTVQGAVISSLTAITLGSSSANTNNRVLVTETGTVSSQFTAIQLTGNGSLLTNFGLINGSNVINGDSAIASKILNYGDMVSTDICATYTGPGTFILNNSGLMQAPNGVVQINSSFGIGVAQIRNSGTMIGDVVLGNGADSYDGRGGTIDGTIFGRAGADTFVLGQGVEVVDGGGDFDTLNFLRTTGVNVYLDGSDVNTGSAAGDVYTSIEIINGSATGADRLTGDAAFNVLRGYGGADILNGGAGNDTLLGGANVDNMTGGLGNDTFTYVALSEAGDAITDFRNIALNNDQFRLSATGFGGGLVVGALAASQFVVAANNLALDVNDRFIFRTIDATLWFDSNGSAAGGLTLLADLQAGATVTSSDILIF